MASPKNACVCVFVCVGVGVFECGCEPGCIYKVYLGGRRVSIVYIAVSNGRLGYNVMF